MGGTLRDILLGEESFDIDIAVEGDAIAFARSLAAALGGRFTPHDKFGTAIVSYGDGGATRRRDHANRVLRLTWRASDGRARGAARGPPAPRLHDQRDGGVPQARGFRAPGGSLRRTVGPGSACAQGAAQPLFHRRPDEDLPRDPLRGTLRSPLRRPHDEPRAGVRRDGPRRGSLVGAVAGRARAAARGSGAPGGIAGSGSWASTGPSIRICEATRKRPRCSTARALRDELQVEAPLWRLGVAVLARDMTSNEALDWLERLKIRRRDIDRIVGAVTVGPRIVERPARSGSIRRRSSRSRIPSPRMPRCSRSRARSSPRSATTSRGCVP